MGASNPVQHFCGGRLRQQVERSEALCVKRVETLPLPKNRDDGSGSTHVFQCGTASIYAEARLLCGSCIKRIAQLVRERAHRERLLKQDYVCGKNAVVNDCLVGVAGHINDTNLRS